MTVQSSANFFKAEAHKLCNIDAAKHNSEQEYNYSNVNSAFLLTLVIDI